LYSKPIKAVGVRKRVEDLVVLWGFGFFTDYQIIFHSSRLRRRSNVNDQTKEPRECVMLGPLSWPGKIVKKAAGVQLSDLGPWA